MNYELAKQLKDAGFPMKEATEQQIKDSSTDIIRFVTSKAWFIVPTFEELIEACGAQFDTLYQADRFKWVAHDGALITQRYTGATPTEAVAKLWLALNKK